MVQDRPSTLIFPDIRLVCPTALKKWEGGRVRRIQINHLPRLSDEMCVAYHN